MAKKRPSKANVFNVDRLTREQSKCVVVGCIGNVTKARRPAIEMLLGFGAVPDIDTFEGNDIGLCDRWIEVCKLLETSAAIIKKDFQDRLKQAELELDEAS